MNQFARWAIVIAAALLSLPAGASERASGTYVASKACDAYSSFAKANNPGSVHTVPGERYDIIEVNQADDYDWVRVDVPTAQPRQRWIARACGVATLDPQLTDGGSGGRGKGRGGRGHGGKGQGGTDKLCHIADQQDSYVLAVTWQPGFCEHFRYKGAKPECDALNSGKLVIDHLTLHGLWPNRKACGTNYDTCGAGDAQPLKLSAETVSRLKPWMPNFYYGSTFGNYEWEKHGTCQSLKPDDYFNRAVSAIEVVDTSAIGATVKSHIGGSFNVDSFFATLRSQYGEQVANNVLLVCADKNFLQEIRINLPRDFALDGGLGKLVGGNGFGARSNGCAAEVRVEQGGRN